jgi:hypothetical protein
MGRTAMVIAAVLAAVTALAPTASSTPLPLLKFVCTGTQTSSRNDVAGKIAMPWKRSFRVNQKSLSVCTEVCRGSRAEISAQKIVMRSADDGRLSQPLTLDRAQMTVTGHQVIPFGAGTTVTIDTTGRCTIAN